MLILVFLHLILYNLISQLYGKEKDINMKVHMTCPSPPALGPTSCGDVADKDDRIVLTLASGLKVMCDTKTDGGGWTIIQRRFNGKVDFYRGWEEYRYGFGNYTLGEFYLGNENIFQLTSKRQYELRVDLGFNGGNYSAKYSRFRVLSEAEKYQLMVEDYSGTAGDDLTAHNSHYFSTRDRDNDKVNLNCAIQYKGAWWYNKCHSTNLNGLWGSTTYGLGVNWYSLTGHRTSASFTEMKIREVRF